MGEVAQLGHRVPALQADRHRLPRTPGQGFGMDLPHGHFDRALDDEGRQFVSGVRHGHHDHHAGTDSLGDRALRLR